MKSGNIYKIISNSISIGLLILLGILAYNFLFNKHEFYQSWYLNSPIIPFLITLCLGIVVNKIFQLFFRKNKWITLTIQDLDLLNDYDCITIQGMTGSGKSYLADLIVKQNPSFTIIDEADYIENLPEMVKMNLSLRQKTIVTIIDYKLHEGLWESIIEMVQVRKIKLAQLRVIKWGEFELYRGI